jgi:hypothetical protein
MHTPCPFLQGHVQTPLPARPTALRQLTSGVTNIVGVTANAQFLINAPLDLAAVASQTNIDTAVSEAWGVQTAVD